jgi:chitin disaccharide deacetylase
MLIINADDFGASRLATDRILSCYKRGSVTSTSAMVFMGDSHRAADLAREFNIDVGLHINFTQELTQQIHSPLFYRYHKHILVFLIQNKYNFLIFNPTLRQQFKFVFQIQLEEFERLYGASPSHIDGHHHMHLCANMLFENIIPAGQKVRRNFSFARGEKSLSNRMYRTVIDKWLARRYTMTDYFFSLSERIKTGRLGHALELAKTSNVELQAHPECAKEFKWLAGNACLLAGLKRGNYAQLKVSPYPSSNSPRRNE